jgi:hypothetical protein
MTQPTQQPSTFSSVLFRTFLAMSFAAFLALAPAPAFAQHGGGGGGGGSHGGGGGGGSHGSSGGGHAASSGSHAGSGSHPTSSTGGNPANPTGGGHWWNPFHGNSTNSNAAAKGSANTGAGKDTNAAGTNTMTRFAAGNNVWQDPPAAFAPREIAPSKNSYGGSNRAVTTPTGTPVHSLVNRQPRASTFSSQNLFRHHPIYYYPYYPFGFSPFYAYGFGCDPFWGCPPGFGYGFGFGYGAFGYGGAFGYSGGAAYGGGNGYDGDLGYYSGNSDNSIEFNSTTPDMAGQAISSPQDNAGDWQDAPENSSQANNATAQPYVVIFLRDGSSYAVSDYWLSGGKLHYVTSYGGENSVDTNQLDLQRTVNENASHGVTFTLRPMPGPDSGAPKQNLQPSPSNSNQTPAPNLQ